MLLILLDRQSVNLFVKKTKRRAAPFGARAFTARPTANPGVTRRTWTETPHWVFSRGHERAEPHLASGPARFAKSPTRRHAQSRAGFDLRPRVVHHSGSAPIAYPPCFRDARPILTRQARSPRSRETLSQSPNQFYCPVGEPASICFNTFSTLKEPTGWRWGNSLNVDRNLPRTRCAGTNVHIWSAIQRM